MPASKGGSLIPQKWIAPGDGCNIERDDRDRVLIPAYLEHLKSAEHNECDSPWTYPMVAHMIQDERDYVSPTALPRCMRQTFLTQAVDYTVDPEKAWARTRGTLMHAGLEQHPEGLTEVKMERSIVIEGVMYRLKGTADNLIREQGKIRDWKTTADIKAMLRYGDLPKADHIEQVSTYGWIASAPDRVWINGVEVDPDIAQGDYTQGEIVYMDARKVRRDIFKLWDHAAVEAMLRVRMPMAQKMMVQGQRVAMATRFNAPVPPEAVEDIPAVLEGEAQWACGYCDVFDACVSLAKREGVEPPSKVRRRKTVPKIDDSSSSVARTSSRMSLPADSQKGK